MGTHNHETKRYNHSKKKFKTLCIEGEHIIIHQHEIVIRNLGEPVRLISAGEKEIVEQLAHGPKVWKKFSRRIKKIGQQG